MIEHRTSRPYSEGRSPEEQLVLGVDGGGTKTVACVARCVGPAETIVIGRGVASTSNLRAVGHELALANLDAAIDAAWDQAQLTCSEVDSAVLALAGAALPDIQNSIATWSQNRSLAKKLKIVHDSMAVLEAGTPNGCGVALVAGTGSVACGKDEKSNVSVAGGWGYWFGDEGSAFSLGQEALRAVTKADDGRGPDTVLSRIILDRLDVAEPRAMLSALSNSADVRQAIAELAVSVSSAAEQQDRVAAEIVSRACRELTTLVKCVASKLHLGNEFPLALAGGVLSGSPVIRENLLHYLCEEKLGPSTVKLVEDPVAGCLKLACTELDSTE